MPAPVYAPDQLGYEPMGGYFPELEVEPDLPFGLPPLPWLDGGMDEGGGCFPGPGLPYDLFGEDNGPSSSGGGGGPFGGMIGKIKEMADKAAKAAKGAGGTSSEEKGGTPFEDMVCY